MKYFARINKEQKGPYSLTELLKEGIRPTTYVWCKGMPDWVHAEDVPDICRGMRRMLAGLDPETGNQINVPDEPPSKLSSADSPETPTVIVFGSNFSDNADELERLASHGYTIPPSSSIIFAILLTILCFPITGLITIYLAIKVKQIWHSGNTEGISSEKRLELRKKAYTYARYYNMMAGITIFLSFLMFGLFLYRYYL